MRKIQQNGFVLLLVIALLAVIGLELFVLADGSNTMLFQTDTAYLQAVESNLVWSGLAWARRNIRDENKEIFDKTIELDITNMNVRDADLIVTTGVPSEEVQLRLSTSCSKSGRILRSDDKYEIRL